MDAPRSLDYAEDLEELSPEMVEVLRKYDNVDSQPSGPSQSQTQQNSSQQEYNVNGTYSSLNSGHIYLIQYYEDSDTQKLWVFVTDESVVSHSDAHSDSDSGALDSAVHDHGAYLPNLHINVH